MSLDPTKPVFKNSVLVFGLSLMGVGIFLEYKFLIGTASLGFIIGTILLISFVVWMGVYVNGMGGTENCKL